MKKLIGIFLIFASALSVSAETYYKVVATFTGNPADGDTVVINGVTKTFKSTVTSANTQIQIGATAALTAANYDAHNQAGQYPYTRIVSGMLSSTVVQLLGDVGFTVTASMSGAWGTAVASPITFTQFPLTLPLSGENALTRATRAGALVDAFAYSATLFPATAPALANFMNLSQAQTVPGAKTFTGANSFANAAQLWNGGNITNVYGGFLSIHALGTVYASNNAPAMYWSDANAAADNKHVLISGADGDWTLSIVNDAFGSANTALQVRRTGGTFDEFYVNGAAEINGLLEAVRISSTNISGLITNASGNFTNAWISNLVAYAGTLTNFNVDGYNASFTNLVLHGGTGGYMLLSNSLPQLIFHATGGGDTAEARWMWEVSPGGTMVLHLKSADGASGSTALTIERSGFSSAAFTFAGNITASGGFTATDGVNVGGAYSYIEDLHIGDFFYTPEMMLTNTTSLAADPVNGARLFALSGEPYYRYVGAGLDMRLHNLALEWVGAGTDHTLGTSYAQMVFGSGGNVISLPSAGTYRLRASIKIEAGGTANAVFAAKFYNATTGFDIVNTEEQISHIPASKKGQLVLESIVTVNAATTVHVYVRNITDATGTIDSVETKLSAVRFY